MLAEKDYYPAVEHFVQTKFNCIQTAVNKGFLYLGLADVIGIIDVSSEVHSQIEVVVVEVKTTIASFGKSLGQALGYSIYGERCYLAATFNGDENFSDEQVYTANHLGVGLIRIPVNNDGRPIKTKIEVVLTSNKHDPISSQKSNISYALGIGVCSVCGIHNKLEEMNQFTRNVVREGTFVKHGNRKMLLCDACYETFVPDELKLKRENIIEGGRKAAKTRKGRSAARKAVETMKKRRALESGDE
jgi:hypothetical protein